jgi:hypothetical protein
VQVTFNNFLFICWTLVKVVQDLGLGVGLCLNQFLFFLFISHKLVSELGLGTSKFE